VAYQDFTLFIDAVQASQKPGALVRLEGAGMSDALAYKMSTPGVTAGVVGGQQLAPNTPGRLVVWGMQLASIDWSFELSPPVAAGLGSLAEKVVGELRGWGAAVDLRPTS
jgi:hydrogenase maturation protease